MAQPRQRRSPNKQQGKAGTGAGTAGLAAGAVAGGAAGSLPGATTAAAGAAAMVEGTKAQAALIASITAALLALLALIARRRRVLMRDTLGKRGIPLTDVDAALVEEDRLEGIYRRRAEKRIADGLKVAAKAPDASARAAGYDAVMRREKQYAWMRAAAAANRVLAAAEREQLRRISPRGAYWSLGVRNQHTADCLAMAGKFWPWSILNIVRPLLHVGCGCFLRSYGDALAAGLLTDAAMISAEDQARIAGPVIQHVRAEQEELERLNEMWTEEIALREKLADAGFDANTLAAAPYAVDELFERFDPDQPRWPKGHPRAGQWRPKISTIGGPERAKVLKAIQDDLGEHMTNIGSLGSDDKSHGKAIEIGKKVMELVDQHGTVPAYRKRLADLEKHGRKNAEARRRKILADHFGIDIPEGDELDKLNDPDHGINGITLYLSGIHRPGTLLRTLRPLMEKAGKDEPTPNDLSKAGDLLAQDKAAATKAWEESTKVAADLQRAHRDAVKAILGTQREMGGTRGDAGMVDFDYALKVDGKGFRKAIAKDMPAVRKYMDEALQYVPSDWLAEMRRNGQTDLTAGKMPKGTGAFFLSLEKNHPANNTGSAMELIQLDGSGGTGPAEVHEQTSNALHEVMHRIERLDHNSDGEVFSKQGERWRDSVATGTGTIPGYGVRGRLGPFRRGYTGRIYKDDPVANEVLSTGAEALFYPNWSDLGEPDDHVYWTAGVYAAY